MENPKLRLGHLIGWPAALVIFLTILVNELLPFILGTGEHAITDWSFPYVTFRFVLLPLACVVHVVANIGFLVFNRRSTLGERLIDSASVVVSAAFLTISYLFPLPFFKGLL